MASTTSPPCRAAGLSLWLTLATALGCSTPLLSSSSPATTGDDPSVNQMTSARQKNLPYCPGGDRGKACVFGQNCRVTEQGCQVCQCNTME
jgi:hypothetical protein